METHDAQLQATFERWDEQRRQLALRKKRWGQPRHATGGEEAGELRRLEVQCEDALTRLLDLLQEQRPR
jgi:hypothetical protein